MSHSSAKKKGLFSQLSAPSSVQPDRDHRLMLKVREGDMKAFETLYNRYKNPVLSYVHRIVGGRSIADEITQEVFLRVYRARESYQASAKFTTWLWTIARNVSIDYTRKKKEVLLSERDNESSSSTLEALSIETTDAQAKIIENQSIEQIQFCIDALPESQKEALLLRTFSELSQEEIAKTLVTTISAVKSLLHRAKTGLLKCLEGSAVHG